MCSMPRGINDVSRLALISIVVLYMTIFVSGCQLRAQETSTNADVVKMVVIVAHEHTLSWGYGAEIAARIGEELFNSLDAPVRRVAAMDTFVAYQPLLEEVILPQAEDLYRAMEELAKY